MVALGGLPPSRVSQGKLLRCHSRHLGPRHLTIPACYRQIPFHPHRIALFQETVHQKVLRCRYHDRRTRKRCASRVITWGQILARIPRSARPDAQVRPSRETEHRGDLPRPVSQIQHHWVSLHKVISDGIPLHSSQSDHLGRGILTLPGAPDPEWGRPIIQNLLQLVRHHELLRLTLH